MFLYLCVILFTRGGGLHPGGSASRGVWEDRPQLDTTGYFQRAGGMHPTGMHSCSVGIPRDLVSRFIDWILGFNFITKCLLWLMVCAVFRPNWLDRIGISYIFILIVKFKRATPPPRHVPRPCFVQFFFSFHLFVSRRRPQQECIPVGCVPTAAVAVTRCHYRGESAPGGSACGGGLCPPRST